MITATIGEDGSPSPVRRVPGIGRSCLHRCSKPLVRCRGEVTDAKRNAVFDVHDRFVAQLRSSGHEGGGLVSVQWVKLDVAGFRTGRISTVSLAAKGLWLDMVTLAAHAGELTRVNADSAYLARQSGASVAEIEVALAELVGARSIKIVSGQALIYGADRIQDALMAKRLDDRKRQQKKRRLDDAQASSPSKPAPATEGSATGPPEPVVATGCTEAQRVKDQLWAALDASMPDTVDPNEAIDAYEIAYEDAIDAGSSDGKYADVAGVGSPSLANVVVSHAACRWFGITPTESNVRRLGALRRDYDIDVIRNMPLAAAKATGDPILYLEAILKNGGAR